MKVNEKTGYAPPTYEFLKNLDESICHHREHELRHPAAIYFSSLTEILDAMAAVLDQVSHLQAANLDSHGRFEFHFANLLKTQKELIGLISYHFEACYSVLKALHPLPSEPIREDFTDKWLFKAGHKSIGLTGSPKIRQYPT
jgi:hypothetical protein